jgi:hypothetical protein
MTGTKSVISKLEVTYRIMRSTQLGTSCRVAVYVVFSPLLQNRVFLHANHRVQRFETK